MAARNEIEARSIITSRVYDAPRRLVFEAWSDPHHLAAWWGPNGFTTTTSAFDMKPGGIWRFVMHGPDGRDYQNRIAFDEVVPPERLVYRHGGGDDAEPIAFHVTVTFEDAGPGKTKLTLHALFPTAAERERVAKEHGAVEGAMQTLERLAAYLAGSAEAPPVLAIERTFDAPRALVWKAWTEADRLAAWWGPKGARIDVAKHELKPGGMFLYAMSMPHGPDLWGKFVYRAIHAPERLVFVSGFSDEHGGRGKNPWLPVWPEEILNTLTLHEANGRTLLRLEGGPINAGEAERKAFADLIESMQDGFAGSFDKLAEHLRIS